MITIIVSTENKAKIEAIKEVTQMVWWECIIIWEKFDSEISEQPMSEEEWILGAINRAKNSQLKYNDADYYIWMEGYVNTSVYGMFLWWVVAIISKDNKIGIGISAKMQLPDYIKQKVLLGNELGPLIQKMVNDSEEDIRQFNGTNGILSKWLYNRVDEFKDATKCALTIFQSPEFYKNTI